MRRNGFKIMANLILLVYDFIAVLLIAIITGVLGFLSATGVVLLGAITIAKLLGEFTQIDTTLLYVSIIGCGVLRGLLRYVEQYSNHNIAFKILAIFRNKIFTKLRELCPAKLESKQKGSIISMITADIEALEVFYAHTLSPISIALFSSIALIVFTYKVCSPIMALFMFVAYVIVGVILPMISSKLQGKYGVLYRENLSNFNGFFMDNVKGINEIILHNKVNLMQDEVSSRTNELIKNSDELNKKATVFEAITEFIIVLLNFGMLFIGINLLSNDVISLGQLIVGVVALTSSYGPVLALNALPNNLSHTFAAGDRVMDLLAETPAVMENFTETNAQFDEISINDVSFSYNDKTPVLNKVNLSIKTGEIIGIQGSSGNGKSTLLKLIMRFWDKNSGEILLGSIDVCEVNSTNLKENITLVSQTTYIFNSTVKENLLLAKSNATDEEIYNACKKANIHEFFVKMEQGYDTVIGGKDTSLSSGEKQRLGLARAFLRDSKFILFDEPTGNVDSINEGIILKSIVDNAKDKGVIIVSHRESTMSIADKVYALEKGELYVKSS